MKAVLIKTINRNNKNTINRISYKQKNKYKNTINSTINNSKLCYIINKLYIKYIIIMMISI